ncbi:hypothetical protein ACIQJX_07585 [Streptomyces griseoviridis]
MSSHHVEIRVDHNVGQILIDGHDIAKGVRSLTFEAGVAQAVPTLTLNLRLVDVTELGSAEARVILDEDTTEALRRLGWTPPRSE